MYDVNGANISVPRGDSAFLPFELTDEATGEPYILTDGQYAVFGVFPLKGADPVITQTLTEQSESGTVTVSLTPADTDIMRGEYVYTSNPRMTQTIDNSASVVQNNVLVPYWKSHPVYKKDLNGDYAIGPDGKYVVDHTQKHYVPSTPQLAASIGLAWNHNYWFIDADLDYLDKAYLDMNPLYRTDMATAGPDGIVTPGEVEYMASQEKFDSQWLLNVSVGKSWYIQRKYQIGFSLQGRNLLNNTWVKTGGYEQTRLVDNTTGKERYYRFDSKYFYMCGANYMLNVYFRF